MQNCIIVHFYQYRLPSKYIDMVDLSKIAEIEDEVELQKLVNIFLF
jgi:hypothetical protein